MTSGLLDLPHQDENTTLEVKSTVPDRDELAALETEINGARKG